MDSIRYGKALVELLGRGVPEAFDELKRGFEGDHRHDVLGNTPYTPEDLGTSMAELEEHLEESQGCLKRAEVRKARALLVDIRQSLDISKMTVLDELLRTYELRPEDIGSSRTALDSLMHLCRATQLRSLYHAFMNEDRSYDDRLESYEGVKAVISSGDITLSAIGVTESEMHGSVRAVQIKEAKRLFDRLDCWYCPEMYRRLCELVDAEGITAEDLGLTDESQTGDLIAELSHVLAWERRNYWNKLCAEVRDLELPVETLAEHLDRIQKGLASEEFVLADTVLDAEQLAKKQALVAARVARREFVIGDSTEVHHLAMVMAIMGEHPELTDSDIGFEEGQTLEGCIEQLRAH